MMKNWLHVLIPVTLLMVTLGPGCTSQEKQQLDALKNEVMAIHDDAMAKMGYMHELEMQIHKLSQADISDTQRNQYASAIEQLQQAHKAMMEWMHQYREPSKDSPPAEQRSYLLLQKEKILHVQQLTDEAVARGEALSVLP